MAAPIACKRVCADYCRDTHLVDRSLPSLTERRKTRETVIALTSGGVITTTTSLTGSGIAIDSFVTHTQHFCVFLLIYTLITFS